MFVATYTLWSTHTTCATHIPIIIKIKATTSKPTSIQLPAGMKKQPTKQAPAIRIKILDNLRFPLVAEWWMKGNVPKIIISMPMPSKNQLNLKCVIL